MKVGLIFLAGGKGTRFGHHEPKQFYPLLGKPVFEYSLAALLNSHLLHEVVIVVDPDYQNYFSKFSFPFRFAKPGNLRQESVFNGFQKISSQVDMIITHDSVRPFITTKMIQDVLKDGQKHGAAALGIPEIYTMKECDQNQMIVRTIPRKNLYQIQTPQVIDRRLLQKSFEHVLNKKIEVTDDVALVETIGHQAKITLGNNKNLKITTFEDIIKAEAFIESYEKTL